MPADAVPTGAFPIPHRNEADFFCGKSMIARSFILDAP
jgi:hypothetical protein